MEIWRTMLAAACLLAAGAGGAQAKCTVGKLLDLPVTMSHFMPTVEAKINGHEARFIADSGNFYSLISLSAAAEFGLHPMLLPNMQISGVGGSMRVDYVVVNDFNLAGIALPHVEFMVGGSDFAADGFLGQNVLGIGDVEYDLAHGEIRLMRSHDCGETSLAYWAPAAKSSMLKIEPVSPGASETIGLVSVNGVTLRATFDTGASTSILNRSAALRAGVKVDGPNVVPSGMEGGVGRHAVQTWITPVADFKIGGEEIKNTHLRIGDTADRGDMVIGADFFLSHRIYVANALHRMFFTYNGGPVFNLMVESADGPGGITPAPIVAAAASGPEPKDADGFGRRGAAFASRQDFGHALADLDRAIALAPTEPRFRVERADLYTTNKQPKLARADLDRAIELKPDDVDARIRRAAARLAEEDKEGARADLAAASDSMPKQADLRFVLAVLEERANDSDRAIADYGAWIALHAEDRRLPEALNSRCWIRALANRELPLALADCSRSLSLSKHDPAVLDSRGLVYLRMGENAKAIADYDKALELAPKQALSRYCRGIAKLRMGNKAAGDADIAAAKALDPGVEKSARDDGIAP